MTITAPRAAADDLTHDVLDRRFEALVFDWDGTAVPDRAADAADVRAAIEGLVRYGMVVVIVTGTHVGNVDDQLRARPSGPGRLFICTNRGSEVYEATSGGAELLIRRRATPDEDRALDTAAADVVHHLAGRGLEARIVSQRLNRRKIDLIPLAEWEDPPKARIGELLTAVSARLRAHGFTDLREVVDLALDSTRRVGLADGRVTSDVKHVEIGLTDKADAARWVAEQLERLGIAPRLVLVGGDEFGPIGGLPGSDSYMLVESLRDATVVSVGAEPGGVPDGVRSLHGGPARFLEILRDQLDRRVDGAPPRTDEDPAWTVTFTGIDPEREPAVESALAISDGSVGTSGAPSCRTADAEPRVYVEGFYKNEGAQTELAPCPVWTELPSTIERSSAIRRTLDLRTGVLHEDIETQNGRLEVVRFSCRHAPGVAVMRAAGPRDLREGGPPLREPRGGAWASGRSDVANWITVVGASDVLTAAAADHHAETHLDRVAVYQRGQAPDAVARLVEANRAGFEELLARHRAAWAKRWADADITIAGDDALQRAVRFALFHLMAQTADRGEAALGARGLTGRAYKGHVFWDADVFVLPFFAATHPATARAMLEYRIRRLPAAMRAARSRRLEGARFPWESADDGTEATPPSARAFTGELIPIRNGEHEEHIVADVAWGADTYMRWTGDDAFIRGPGKMLLVETARYWASRIRIHDGGGHLYGVIGPDEYHDPVDDNAYTNVMARWNLRRAAAIAKDDLDPAEIRTWLELADRIVDGYDEQTAVYEQFDGFHKLEPLIIAELASRPIVADQILGRGLVHDSQIVKQPDVLMLHHLVPDEVAPGSLVPNFDHYEPRTAHGSSLSPGIHASLYARTGRPDAGLAYLDLAAYVDLDGSSAGGLHVASMGSLWQAIVMGYVGVRPDGDVLVIDPQLPSTWDELTIRLRFHGRPVRLRITHDGFEAEGDVRVEVRR